jgi:cbb3-type cytochrome oxidase subunit 1
MEWFVRAFMKSSLVWLGFGVTLGLAMAVHPAWLIYRPAHLHMNLLGFVTMMIFGVAYHVLPRFSGHPLHSRRLAGLHWGIANLGLTTMVAGFVLAPRSGVWAIPLLAAGGMLSATGAYLFIFNMWRTIDGPALRPMALPVLPS